MENGRREGVNMYDNFRIEAAEGEILIHLETDGSGVFVGLRGPDAWWESTITSDYARALAAALVKMADHSDW